MSFPDYFVQKIGNTHATLESLSRLRASSQVTMKE